MVNLQLTKSELAFLQRLIGHTIPSHIVPPNLYDKIADKTDAWGITNSSPLNLKDVSEIDLLQRELLLRGVYMDIPPPVYNMELDKALSVCLDMCAGLTLRQSIAAYDKGIVSC